MSDERDFDDIYAVIREMRWRGLGSPEDWYENIEGFVRARELVGYDRLVALASQARALSPHALAQVQREIREVVAEVRP